MGASPVKLSVAMITYNHERFIAQALESVLRQRVNFSYEIVIGDDHSTDSTASIIAEFHRRNPDRIVPFLREENVGGPRNIEHVLASCKGEYVAMLEGDDYWTCEDKLQRQVDFLDGNPDFTLCCSRVQTIDAAGTASATFPPKAGGSYTLENLLAGNFVMTCSTLFRRDALYPLPHMQDLSPLDWARSAIIATRGQIFLFDEILAAYRVHSGGFWSSNPEPQKLQETIRMLLALDAELGFRHSRVIRRTIASYQLTMAMIARSQGKRLETARWLLRSLRNGGWGIKASRRIVAALAAYSLLGSRYKAVSALKLAIPE